MIDMRLREEFIRISPDENIELIDRADLGLIRERVARFQYWVFLLAMLIFLYYFINLIYKHTFLKVNRFIHNPDQTTLDISYKIED